MASEKEKEEVLLKYISRIQRKLTDPETKQDKVIKYLENLQKLPISFNILKLSGVGKTVNKLKKQDNSIGEIARNLIIKWKGIVSPQKSQKIETEVNSEGTKAKDKNEINEGSKFKSKQLLPSNRDHWKDVSLDLIGEKAAEKMNEKLRNSKCHKKSQRNSMGSKDLKPNFEETKKRHLIELKRDHSMPPLPDIKLPEIQQTYRPMHFSYLTDDRDGPPQRKKANVAIEELESVIVSRKSRTQVFSGRRSNFGGVVQSLYNQCMKVLADNIDALEDTGGVPFDILEPILLKVSPAQLIRLEEFNPYFTEDSGGLWKQHCEKEFRGCIPDEMESWRELYLRKCAERSEKLKCIQSKISASQQKKEPMRQAKLAYIAETSSKVQRRPLKHGADKCANKNENRAKKLKVELDERHKSEAEHTIVSVKVPKRERCPPVGGRNSQRTDILSKKTTCKPMMKAAMKMMKSQRSRSKNQIMRK